VPQVDEEIEAAATDTQPEPPHETNEKINIHQQTVNKFHSFNARFTVSIAHTSA
jgi:hypothetical protein